MAYVLMFYETAESLAERRQDDRAPAYWGAWRAYVDAVVASGLMQSGNGLEPPETAVSLRLRDGERHVQDGPVSATKEQLGGYIVLDTTDVDAALQWAARSPAAAYGAVEVRPVMPSPSD